jgi:hypothetical protein
MILVLRKRRLGGTLSNVAYISSELLHLRVPYLGKPQLDSGNENAITLPQGTVIAAATLLLLVFGDDLP